MSDTTQLAIAPAPRTERAASALRLSRRIAAAVVGIAALGFVLAGYGLSMGDETPA